MPTTPEPCATCGAMIIAPVEVPAHAMGPDAVGTRVCEYEGCPATASIETMVRLDSGEWYCPPHTLLLAGRELISLSPTEGEGDWTIIREVINQWLPEVVAKMEKWSQQSIRTSFDTTSEAGGVFGGNQPAR